MQFLEDAKGDEYVNATTNSHPILQCEVGPWGAGRRVLNYQTDCLMCCQVCVEPHQEAWKAHQGYGNPLGQVPVRRRSVLLLGFHRFPAAALPLGGRRAWGGCIEGPARR